MSRNILTERDTLSLQTNVLVDIKEVVLKNLIENVDGLLLSWFYVMIVWKVIIKYHVKILVKVSMSIVVSKTPYIVALLCQFYFQYITFIQLLNYCNKLSIVNNVYI